MEQILIFMPWIWGAIILATIIIELFSSDIDAIWFSAGALVALVLSLFDVHIVVQLSVFVAVTAILLFTVGRLAKKALMRPIDSSNPDPFYADLEKEMLEKINKLGIGPQGFGGKTTAIGLNIETLPTHIAGMPCANNINCHVTRHKTEVI